VGERETGGKKAVRERKKERLEPDHYLRGNGGGGGDEHKIYGEKRPPMASGPPNLIHHNSGEGNTKKTASSGRKRQGLEKAPSHNQAGRGEENPPH